MTKIRTTSYESNGRKWEVFDHVTIKELEAFIQKHPSFPLFYDIITTWAKQHGKSVVISSILTSRASRSIRSDPWHSTLRAIDLAFVDPFKQVILRRVPMARNNLLIRSVIQQMIKQSSLANNKVPMIGIESDHFHIEYARYPNSVVIYNDRKTPYDNEQPGIKNIIPLNNK